MPSNQVNLRIFGRTVWLKSMLGWVPYPASLSSSCFKPRKPGCIGWAVWHRKCRIHLMSSNKGSLRELKLTYRTAGSHSMQQRVPETSDSATPFNLSLLAPVMLTLSRNSAEIFPFVYVDEFVQILFKKEYHRQMKAGGQMVFQRILGQSPF